MKDDREAVVRQALHLWQGLMETVPTDRLQEAWLIARAIQTAYLRFADERHQAGVEAGKRERQAVDEARSLTDADLGDLLRALPFERTH